MRITPELYARYDRVFRGIAAKATRDAELQEDCVQEAWKEIHLLEPPADARNLDAYIRRAAQFTMLSYLRSWNTGNWYTGRTLDHVRDENGQRVKEKARYVRIDRHVTAGLLQIDNDGRVLPGEAVESDSYYYTKQLEEGGFTVVLPL